MAQKTVLKPSIIKLVQKYGKDITKRGIFWDQLIIFGSQAKGTRHKWSDIDVCIVSDQFSNNRFENRLLLAHNRSDNFYNIEPHPFRPEELQDKWDPLATEIRNHGIVVQ